MANDLVFFLVVMLAAHVVPAANGGARIPGPRRGDASVSPAAASLPHQASVSVATAPGVPGECNAVYGPLGGAVLGTGHIKTVLTGTVQACGCICRELKGCVAFDFDPAVPLAGTRQALDL